MDYNKWFIVYVLVFTLVFMALLPNIILDPDNGTHALLSLFYKNMASSVVESGSYSFQKIYDFGIAYLVHYPKLQVFYPPVYHLATGLVFYTAFGISAWSAGLCNLMFAVLSICVMYVLVMKMFNPKAALIAAVLFSLFPYLLMVTGRAMMEPTVMFFLLLSLLVYMEVKDSKRLVGFAVLAVVSSLAVLSKQAAFFTPLVFLLHLAYKRKWKQAAVFAILSAVLLAPYGLLVVKTGGLDVGPVIWGRYAYENLPSLELSESLSYPFIAVILLGFVYEMWKGEHKGKSLFAVWFIVFLIGTMLLISFKVRYFIYFLIPAVVLGSNYLSRRNKYLLAIFMTAYLLSSIYLTLPNMAYYPIESAAREVYDSAPAGSGVVMLSEGDSFYSSSLMFYLDKFDSESTSAKGLFVYRPCALTENYTGGTMQFLKDNNAFYIVAVPGEDGYERLAPIRDSLEQVRSGYVELYKVKDFQPVGRSEYCNYVCLTSEPVCTDYSSPYDAL